MWRKSAGIVSKKNGVGVLSFRLNNFEHFTDFLTISDSMHVILQSVLDRFWEMSICMWVHRIERIFTAFDVYRVSSLYYMDQTVNHSYFLDILYYILIKKIRAKSKEVKIFCPHIVNCHMSITLDTTWLR